MHYGACFSNMFKCGQYKSNFVEVTQITGRIKEGISKDIALIQIYLKSINSILGAAGKKLSNYVDMIQKYNKLHLNKTSLVYYSHTYNGEKL